MIFRLFWLALVAVHVAPLVSVVDQCVGMGFTVGLVGKGLAVLASMGFFGAKAAGAQFLRVRCRITGAVVFLAACSFVHQDLRDQIYADPAVAVTAAAVAAVTVGARKRLWARVSGTGWESLMAMLRARVWHALVEPAVVGVRLIQERASTVPRGPPVA